MAPSRNDSSGWIPPDGILIRAVGIAGFADHSSVAAVENDEAHVVSTAVLAVPLHAAELIFGERHVPPLDRRLTELESELLNDVASYVHARLSPLSTPRSEEPPNRG